MTHKTFLFVDADFDLFKSCFMEAGEWENCKFEVAPDKCSREHLASLLSGENVAAVIFMEGRTKHWEALKQYYLGGGVVVFFGIIGEYQAPYHFSNRLGFTWRFSAYTRHEFELTAKAASLLGNSVTSQQYTKCNLISVPEEDRWMVPKAPTLEEFMDENVGYSDEANADEDTLEEIREARERYPAYVEELYNQCPLAVHQESNGGKFIYLGFVNGDGNIPKFVRGLLLGEMISA
jgi:hypothetical protein